MKKRSKVQRKKITSRYALSMLRGSWGRVVLRRAEVCEMPSFLLSDNERMNECGVLLNRNDSQKPKRSKRNLSWFQSDHQKSRTNVLVIDPGLRSEKPANKCLRYGTTAASVYIRRPVSFIHVSYLILSLEISINVWLRIHFFLDMIILIFARRNLSCK